jgi:hypothetical protein
MLNRQAAGQAEAHRAGARGAGNPVLLAAAPEGFLDAPSRKPAIAAAMAMAWWERAWAAA